MQIYKLVRALLAGDLLTARQFVTDARRSQVQWQQIAAPSGLSDIELAVAAAIVELFATRAGVTPPVWTTAVGAIPELLILDPGLEDMPRSFARAKNFGPESLLKRNIVALPDFLDVP